MSAAALLHGAMLMLRGSGDDFKHYVVTAKGDQWYAFEYTHTWSVGVGSTEQEAMNTLVLVAPNMDFHDLDYLQTIGGEITEVYQYTRPLIRKNVFPTGLGKE